jgi:TonB family protein
LIILSAGSASLADSAASAASTNYAQAFNLLKSGKDNPRAMSLLEEAALEGDARSVLLLGAIYFEGKVVPQNRPLGFAYLKLAALYDSPPYQSRKQAEEWMRTAQATLSGRELIEADRLAAKLQADSHARLALKFGPAVRMLTNATPTQYNPAIRFASDPVEVRVAPTGEPAAEGALRHLQGCGARSTAGCPSASRPDDVARCTGQVFSPDTAPSSAVSEGAVLVALGIPVGVLRARGGGSVTILLHVARSGWICNAIVAVPSGTRSIDEPALAAVAKWKLKPASKSSEPVEALHLLRFIFQVVD